MPAKNLKIRSKEGGEFDCYLATPDAGISCHGTQMLDFLKDLEGVSQPVCIIWGDQDHAAPPEVQKAYRGVPARMKNVEVHIFPGVLHGYMMQGNPKAFDRKTYEFSMARALAILNGLRREGLKAHAA